MKLIIFTLLLFSLAGVYFTSVLVHEMIHHEQYKNFVISSEICLLNYEPSWKVFTGYYIATYNLSDEAKVKSIKEIEKYNGIYKEVPAYLIQILIILIWLSAVIPVAIKTFLNSECVD